MIVIDTSVLVALLLHEPDSAVFEACMAAENEIAIAAPTKFEFLLVATSRLHENGLKEARNLLDQLPLVTVDWTDQHADLAADAFARFGKGRHPAGLNFGDCMTYALAKSLDAPLLFKGDDFVQTDLRSAL